MPGSQTPQGLLATRHFCVADNIAFHSWNSVGTLIFKHFGAQFPAYICPCQRFAPNLTIDSA
jgi:hypothetical protein